MKRISINTFEKMKTVYGTSLAACLRRKTTLFFMLFSVLLYGACNDTIDSIGMGIQPPEDKIKVYDTVINIDSACTVKADSVYTKTGNGLLGNFYDPDYGDIKSGYICQYYPSLGFADSVLNNKIDSVQLRIYYSSYFGDSLAPMEVSVYEVTRKPLENSYYTNINPDDYCDRTQVWAKKTYTARDLNVPDSVYNSSTYYKNITIPLPVDWGQKLYEQYVENGRTFGSLKNFSEKFFKGTYLESSFGVGNLIMVDISEIQLFYQKCYKKDDGNDTIVTGAAAFTVTKEVMQLNRFENKYSDELLEDSDDKMYLKTPAGVFSKIIIPIPKIVESIGKRKFSSVKLNIGAYAQETRDYTLPLPGAGVSSTSKAKLLLIEPDSVKSFFENQKVADFLTSYTTTYSSSTQSYIFDNIANLIQNAIEKAPDKNLEALLIPVQVEYYANYSSEMDYSTAHYLYPSAVTLKKGENNLQLKIVASDLEVNNR
ncbi:MAG: DUF4270 domain-containing protein [Dysgonamonadaceae bacterium]|jgi:hypothetical protein|nr:DUF4270 domain-containing protein [Dysgonamonadaceae bacterium]